MNKIILFLIPMYILCVAGLYGEDFFRVKESIEQNAWQKRAGLYLAPGFRFNNLGYSSNVYSYEYLKKPDWSANLRFNLDLAVIVKERLILQVKESPSYSTYLENESDRAFNNEINLTVYTWLNRFNLKYEYQHFYNHDRSNPESGWSIRRWEENQTVTMDYGSMTHFYIEAFLRRTTLAYEDELVLNSFNLNQLFNRKEYWVGMSLNRRVFTRSRFSLEVDYYDQRFRYSPQRDRTGTEITAGFYFPAGSNITGSLRYGIRYIKPVTTRFRDFIRPSGSGQVDILLMRRFQIHMQYMLDNRYSFTGVDVYYDERTIGGGMSYFPCRWLTLGYLYSFGQREYKLLSGGGVTRLDDIETSRISMAVQIGSNMEIGMEYRTYRAISTALRYNSSFDYIGGYINYDF